MSDKTLPRTVLGFRHLQDVDALKTHALDSPLVNDGINEQREAEIVTTLLDAVESTRHDCVKILYSPSLQRTAESARRVGAALSERITTTISPEDDLTHFNQGRPSVPPDFKDGDRLQALDDAWDTFCEATFGDKNIGYRFGDPWTGSKKETKLIGKFDSIGESEADFLIRQYTFLEKLLADAHAGHEKELVVFCGQDITLLLLLQIKALQESGEAVLPEELYFQCWDVYKAKIEKEYKDDYGRVHSFDLSGIDVPKWLSILERARTFLEERMRVSADSIQGQVNSTSNDYSEIGRNFRKRTGRELDDTETMEQGTPFYPVSVVVPYYRSASTIMDVLQSIELQNLSEEEMKNVEVIVVDDGSKDDIKEMLEGKQYRFRLKLITCPQNGGRSSARNIGANNASHDILVFLDADNLLSGNSLREHAVRNQLAPDQLYTSLVANVFPADVKKDLHPYYERQEPLPKPETFNEFRTSETIPAGSPGSDYPFDVTVEILKDTDNFRKYGYGRRIGPYDLPSMYATYFVSVTKDMFEKIGGFSEEFRGWGMEDTYFGAVGLTKGAKIIPVLSCGSYSINLPSHSGSEEKEQEELRANIGRYNTLMRRPTQ
ncbi:MAG: glycosyltransferase family 2 protein [bacterium]|nr:glycosyltransferase family 2 protein [bacterium]